MVEHTLYYNIIIIQPSDQPTNWLTDWLVCVCTATLRLFSILLCFAFTMGWLHIDFDVSCHIASTYCEWTLIPSHARIQCIYVHNNCVHLKVQWKHYKYCSVSDTIAVLLCRPTLASLWKLCQSQTSCLSKSALSIPAQLCIQTVFICTARYCCQYI